MHCAHLLLIIYVAWIFHGSESRKVASKGELKRESETTCTLQFFNSQNFDSGK